MVSGASQNIPGTETYIEDRTYSLGEKALYRAPPFAMSPD